MQVAALAADAQQLLQRGVVARTAAEREGHQHGASSTCHVDSSDNDDQEEDNKDERVGEMQVAAQAEDAQATDAQQLLQRDVVARTTAELEKQQHGHDACHDLGSADVDNHHQDRE